VNTGKRIFFFGDGVCEADPDRKDILGGKGSSLVAMCAAGLPIPPGFVISVPCCRYYHEHSGQWPEGLADEVSVNLKRLEKVSGRTFGRGPLPLLVSVRSGAAVSMPGMMDTILNCGLCPEMAQTVADRELFWSVYAAFIQQFGEIVGRIPREAFEEAAAQDAQSRALRWMAVYEEKTGRKFPTEPWDALCQCINAVFESWNNERAQVYRNAHRLTDLEGTAVTVQQMFDSEVSGITFTANPTNPNADEIVIESALGLGESVVSGDVEPDRFVVDRKTLAIKERAIGKKLRVMSGLSGTSRSTDPLAPSLSDEEVRQVAEMALKVEAYFGMPMDIEWGFSRGTLALLQSRPIRGLETVRLREEVRQEEIRRIRQLASRRPKVWIIHNLAETLPFPTPMTWDIMSEFMSGRGGFGQMYRDFGYRPSKVVCEEGFLDLLFGRIFADPDRVAELFWPGFPMGYDHAEVLANPAVLQAPPTKFDATKADEAFLLRLPATFVAMLRSGRMMKRLRGEVLARFTGQILPPYLEYVREKRQQDLARMTTEGLIAELEERNRKVLTEFGNESLKPGFFGGTALAQLENLLTQILGPSEGRKLSQALTSGLENDSTVEQNILLYRVSQKQATMEEFLERYGHRAVGEMELERPRFREDQAYLHQMIAGVKAGTGQSPEEMHRQRKAVRLEAMRNLRQTLASCGASSLHEDVERLAVEAQTLLPYREIGKHYLMMGYELLRSVLLELGRRWGIGDGVFFLRRQELPGFEAKADVFCQEICRRRQRLEVLKQLDVPDIINSEEAESLGLKRQIAGAKEFAGSSLSTGVAAGTARIVFSPEQAGELGDDAILVCPSTDPSWTALFTTIKGLVVERGGILSHGAITARDFGIPAVAYPDATQLIPAGAEIQVDGDAGVVRILKEPHA